MAEPLIHSARPVRILLVGAGGLGGPAALGLAAGLAARATQPRPPMASPTPPRLTVLDDDVVEPSNLSRQLLFTDDDVGRSKATALVEALARRFPGREDVALAGRLTALDGEALVAAHDLVLDGSDNFPTRFLANDLCVRLGRPLVHGAALQWLGQLLVVRPGVTPCLRCLFEGEPPPGAAPTCAEAGVVSPLVGLVGGWMAEAALALLTDTADSLPAGLRTVDAWRGRERVVPVGRDPSCCACGALR